MALSRTLAVALALLAVASLAHCRELKAVSSKYVNTGSVNLYYYGGDGLLWNFLPRATATASLSISYDAGTRMVSKVQAAAWTSWITPLVSSPGPFLCDVSMIQYGKVSTIGGGPKLTGLTPYSAIWPSSAKVRWTGEKKWSYYTPKGNTLEVEVSCLLALQWAPKNAYTPAGDKGVLKLRTKIFTP